MDPVFYTTVINGHPPPGGEGDDRGWDGWMASLTRWTWVWVNSRSWWWTGRPGVLRFMGPQRVGHDWTTELKHGSASYISLWTPPNLWSIIPDNEIMTFTCPREKCPIKNKTIRNIINNKSNRTSAVGSIASWGTLRLDPSICWNLMANG